MGILHENKVVIDLTESGIDALGKGSIDLSWQPKSGKARRDVIPSVREDDQRPIRSETRATLLRALAQGRRWLQELTSGKARDTEVIAAREGRSKRSVHMMISLAFLAPDIVEAAVAGKLPRGIRISRLVDLPASWAKQRERLGWLPKKSGSPAAVQDPAFVS